MTLVPVYVAAAIFVVVVRALLLIVVRNGRYAEGLLRKAARIRPLRRRMIQSHLRDLEQSNPVAARAYSKMDRVTGVAGLKHTRGLFPCCHRRNVGLIWNCSMTGTPTG